MPSDWVPPAPSPAQFPELAAASPAAGGLTPDTPIACRTLHAIVPARCCVLRQLLSQRQRTADTWRGIASEHPSCTHRCAQGVAIREELAAAMGAAWRGAGPGRRFIRTRDNQEEQHRARKRQERRGLLTPVPTVDQPPGDQDLHPHPSDGPAGLSSSSPV